MPISIQEFVEARRTPAWRAGSDRLILESQVWQGRPWRHEILIAEPPQGRSGDTAILEITGDNVADEDLIWARHLAAQSGLPVFVLCQVPNQPIWDLREDFLIAHTFELFLDGQGDDWPLLYPMTLAAASALDAIQEWSAGEISRFVVTGASKRGWTSWLLGAINDPRVIGIAPRLFDNLHFIRQIVKQKRHWQSFSKEVDPYVERDLPARFQTPEGIELLRRVDPWYSLEKISIPILMLHGALDPFWIIDALQEYWNDIQAPKWCLVAPHRGHEMWPIHEWAPTLTAFSDVCQGEAVFFEPGWDHQIVMNPREEHRYRVHSDPEVLHWRLDVLASVGRYRFTSDSVFSSIEPDQEGIARVGVWENNDLAVMPQITLRGNKGSFPVSLPPHVIPGWGG